ncbi:MAG: catalase-peroxidase, partial [Micrococcales bacterium]|nr:catalase-peroxidase [Micrococcales bacterium]
GHTFGKTHGAAPEEGNVGREPEGAPLQQMGLGWKNSFGTGSGDDAITSGLEGAWTPTPTAWDNSYFETLFAYDWELTKSPAGAHQWIPKGGAGAGSVPDPHDPSKSHTPVMLTTDLALRADPIYEPISRHFMEHPDELAQAFAKAWFKLTHRDMGPLSRYRGPQVPAEPLIWQDPVPAVDYKLVDDSDVEKLKTTLVESGLSIGDLVGTAWASASTYRNSDKRGGANGARIRLAPQNSWEVNNPSELARVLRVLEGIQEDFNAAQSDGTQVSLADLIVLGGCAGIEQAAKAAGAAVQVPFTPGRTDATPDETDEESFAWLELTSDGFRNYLGKAHSRPAEHLLIDRSSLLGLTPPEMTALVGGLRVLGANHDGSDLGVLTDRPGVLTNDFFVNLLDMATVWEPTSDQEETFIGRDRDSGATKWNGSRVDLVFGSNSQLRALSEVFASSDGQAQFVRDFVGAWVKVMNADRFDLN